MPLHTNSPGSQEMIFVHPKNGKFIVTNNGADEEYQAIEGSLDLVRMEFDPGNPEYKIQPYDAFIMHIRDSEDSSKVYRIKMNVERNFVFSVARVLNDLSKDDKIIAKAKAGDDPTVTFCNILKMDSTGSWVRPASEELPADKSKRVEFVKTTVENHSAYSPKKESSE